MRFLLDQNADRRFLPYLRSLGHDVTSTGIDDPSSLAREVMNQELQQHAL
jgi:hypothetical protein